MANTVKNPYDMDSTTFDAEKYLEKLLKDCTLKQIMDTEAAVVKDTQTLHSDMQTLVYENYNKFISATDTIRKMKNDFKQMETDMDLLKDKMNTITTFSEQITGTLQGTRSRLCRLSEKHSLLKRLQFLSSLPGKLKALIEEQNYVQAVQDYKHAQKVFEQYGFQPSFEGIRKDCDVIMTDLKQYLRQEFQRAGKTAQSLTEIGELLLQLDEKAPDMATEMLNCASKRLHEQVVMLQDQTERDMIEFVDMGIEGLLNDLTLVVTSYFDMFVAKHYENERDDFQEHALKELNVFLNVNIDKYLTLVQDRVESDVGFGNTQVMLRALDRLHRRLLAMRNICRGIEIQRNTVDIIISAAHQLCDTHSKNLKDHFSDSLSSVRISLVSSKSDSVSGANLNDLITNLYVSLVEKVRGVLQDLLVFLQTDWSFNIKSDHKGTLCMEGIRENLLIGFLRHISKVISSFGDTSTSSPPNLLLVLSKTCLEMEQNGVHILISLADDLYEIDSENSAILTHETEICAEMRETAQSLLDTFVRLQGFNISQMLRKSVETRDWLNCLEPRTVRAVMKRVVDELSSIETVVASLYDYPPTMRTTASSDSSRKTHFSNLTNSKQQFRSNWSNYTPSQLESSYVSNIHRLFSERIDIFTSVEFSKVSIITGIIKIGLKTLLESVRLRTFSKFGLQQIQVDTHYLQMNLWRFVKDENLINFLLDEILGSAVHRCLESTLMEPNAVEIICERVIFLRVHYKSIKLAEKKMQMALCQSSVLKVYHAVIEDVIANVRDAFLDEGVDEQVLQEMKQIWRTKLMASKAVEIKPDPPETQPPLIVANNPKPTKAQVAKAKKAAAAAAAASQHQQQQQNNNNGAAQSASSNCSSSSVTADVKPNIVNLQQLSNVPSTTAGTSTVTNTTINGTIKQEPQQQQQQSQPPPLHPTSSNSAIILQQQKQQQQQQVGGSNQQQQPAASSSNNQPQSSTIAILATLDPNRIMPVNITLPAQLGTMNSESRVLTIHVPASALQENQLTQILTAHLISSIMSLPTTLASSVLQQHVNAALVNANMQKNFNTSKQLDGAVDTSDEDESEESDGNMDDDDNDDLDKEDESDVENEGGAEEEPLNSEDDVTDEDASDLFDTDNVIVCQYDKITRSRNKWKFYLKDGIMNIGGKDYVFQKSNGDAEW